MASTKKKRTTTRAKKAAAPVGSPARKDLSDEQATAKADVVKAENKLPNLFRWNKWLAFIHAFQGLAVLVLGVSAKLPVSTSFLTPNPIPDGDISLVIASKHLFDIDLVWLVASFFFISAIAHATIASVYRVRYEADLARGINRVRWFEYAASASVMMVGIALLSGVYDAAALLAIFALTAIMNFTGLAMETYNQGKKEISWLAYSIGCMAGLVPWFIVAFALFSANVYGDGSIPTFVYWIFGTMFVLFSSFAVNMYLQYARKGKWADYLYGERMYMVLSLVAKTILAWQIFAGALRP